jgi:hypothetical protein
VPRIDEVVKKNVGVICVFFCVFAVVFGWIDAESVGAPSGRDGMPPWVLYDFWQPFVTRL